MIHLGVIITSNWIRCDNRVPEESGEYLVTVLVDDDNAIVLNAWYDTRVTKHLNSKLSYMGWSLLNEWYGLSDNLRDMIVAWMPIPEAYSDGDELMWSDDSKIDSAVNVAFRFGGIDGEHYKTWVIDQMLHCLLTNDKYDEFIKEHSNNGEYKDWNRGTAP
jgi:hypothetical protein